MRVLICVDDTDDLTKETSTGEIAEKIAEAIKSMGGGEDKGITRHQLLLHEDIDYTSHNSSMCMDMNVQGITLEDIEKIGAQVILGNMASFADPGLCICRPDQLKLPDKLVSFGKRAQEIVLQKEDAYALAEEIGGTILKEYGGDGSGVIGALAGVGLRLSGADGTFRGGKDAKYAGTAYTVGQWIGIDQVEQVVDTSGKPLPMEVIIHVEERIKFALLRDKKTLVAEKRGAMYYGCDKKALYDGGRKIELWTDCCRWFSPDNDMEECLTKEVACYNCLFRRWTSEGYSCMRGK